MHPIIIIVFAPLVAAIVAGLFGRAIGKTAAKAVTTGALVLSCVLSWPIFLSFLAGSGQESVVPVLDWIRSGDLIVDWALRVDALTAVMLVVVTTVSTLVHIYSWGYMEEDPSQSRFFAYLSLFTFAMLMLVTADSLIQMFFGWEGVGLASYLLIGFWYHKPSANAAAIKAFVVNRVGDFSFSLGIFGTFLVFGTVSIPVILAAAPAMAGSTIGFAGMTVDTMTLICLLLFVGAMGKSAQLGLHTWLPDAMEGPTPVSALIHAATMVTAGVFMVCRLSPMFEVSPVALTFVTYVGLATALFAATVALVQNDIKRVIAYSTCSQLGFMFFAAGVGAYGAAMFHLPARHHLEAAQLSCGLHPAVRLDDAHHHVGIALRAAVTFVQHREGLADPRRGTQVDAQRPASHDGQSARTTAIMRVPGRRVPGRRGPGSTSRRRHPARRARRATGRRCGRRSTIGRGRCRARASGPPESPGCEHWRARCADRAPIRTQ